MVCCFRTWIFGVSWFVLISYFPTSSVCFTFIFVSFLSMFSPPLCFTFLSKDEDFYLQHTLLVLSSVFVRRDSSVIKEEIKAFLANRRISQAVVAQVTGKSWRALYSGIWSSLCLLVQMLEYCLHFCIAVQICQLRHNNVCLWFKTHCLRYLGTSPVIFFFFYLVLVNFTAFVKSTKFPILWLKRILWFSCNCDRAYDTCTSNCFQHFIFLKALQSSKSTPWFYQLKKDSWEWRMLCVLTTFSYVKENVYSQTITEKIRITNVFSLFFYITSHYPTNGSPILSMWCICVILYSDCIFYEVLELGGSMSFLCWSVVFFSQQ